MMMMMRRRRRRSKSLCQSVLYSRIRLDAVTHQCFRSIGNRGWILAVKIAPGIGRKRTKTYAKRNKRSKSKRKFTRLSHRTVTIYCMKTELIKNGKEERNFFITEYIGMGVIFVVKKSDATYGR
jgi:hypothetical protein